MLENTKSESFFPLGGEIESVKPLDIWPNICFYQKLCCSILLKIIRDIATGHLGTFKGIRQSQHGFVKEKSCLINLLQCFIKITMLWIKEKLWNLKKAFDEVPHQSLLQIIKAHGVGGNILITV